MLLMLFSSLILLSSIIFLELKYLRLATCSQSKATPCLQHPFPHSYLKPTFLHSFVDICFIQLPKSTHVPSNLQALSRFSNPLGEAWTFRVPSPSALQHSIQGSGSTSLIRDTDDMTSCSLRVSAETLPTHPQVFFKGTSPLPSAFTSIHEVVQIYLPS